MLKVKCNASELVTSLMLNYVLLYLGLYIVVNYLRDASMNANYSNVIIISQLIGGALAGIGGSVELFGMYDIQQRRSGQYCNRGDYDLLFPGSPAWILDVWKLLGRIVVWYSGRNLADLRFWVCDIIPEDKVGTSYAHGGRES